MAKVYDVFISYSFDDQNIAESICGYLESKGYKCFVAHRDIPRGVVWAAAITNAIDESAMMAVVFSSSFNDSTQTDREIELASENRLPILTYRIADIQMTGAKKYYLKNLNWIDAFPDPESCLGRLLDSVSILIGSRQKASDNNTVDIPVFDNLSKQQKDKDSQQFQDLSFPAIYYFGPLKTLKQGGYLHIYDEVAVFKPTKINIGDKSDKIIPIRDICGYKKGILYSFSIYLNNGIEEKLGVAEVWKKDEIIQAFEARRNALFKNHGQQVPPMRVF